MVNFNINPGFNKLTPVDILFKMMAKGEFFLALFLLIFDFTDASSQEPSISSTSNARRNQDLRHLEPISLAFSGDEFNLPDNLSAVRDLLAASRSIVLKGDALQSQHPFEALELNCSSKESPIGTPYSAKSTGSTSNSRRRRLPKVEVITEPVIPIARELNANILACESLDLPGILPPLTAEQREALQLKDLTDSDKLTEEQKAKEETEAIESGKENVVYRLMQKFRSDMKSLQKPSDDQEDSFPELDWRLLDTSYLKSGRRGNYRSYTNLRLERSKAYWDELLKQNLVHFHLPTDSLTLRRNRVLEQALDLFRRGTKAPDAQDIDWSLLDVRSFSGHACPFDISLSSLDDVEQLEYYCSNHPHIVFLNPSTVDGRIKLLTMHFYKMYSQIRGSDSDPFFVRFEEIRVEGWPEDVPMNVSSWNQIHATCLETALGTIKFYPKSGSLPTPKGSRASGSRRSQLNYKDDPELEADKELGEQISKLRAAIKAQREMSASGGNRRQSRVASVASYIENSDDEEFSDKDEELHKSVESTSRSKKTSPFSSSRRLSASPKSAKSPTLKRGLPKVPTLEKVTEAFESARHVVSYENPFAAISEASRKEVVDKHMKNIGMLVRLKDDSSSTILRRRIYAQLFDALNLMLAFFTEPTSIHPVPLHLLQEYINALNFALGFMDDSDDTLLSDIRKPLIAMRIKVRAHILGLFDTNRELAIQKFVKPKCHSIFRNNGMSDSKLEEIESAFDQGDEKIFNL